MTLDVQKEPASLEPSFVLATPSKPVTFTVKVTNSTRGTRTYEARAVGLKNAVAVSSPRLLELGAGQLGRIAVTITADRSQVTFPNGKFLIGVELHDTTPSDPSVTLLSAEVEVLSVDSVSLAFSRPHLSGWRRGKTTLQLHNKGEREIPLDLSGVDPDDHFDFRFSRKGRPLRDGKTIDLPARSSRAVTLRLKAEPLYFGANTTRAFEVVARGPGGTVATTGTFKQRPLFHPILFKIIAGVLLVIAGMFIARAVVQRFIADPPVFTWEELANTDVGDGQQVPGRVGHTAVWVGYEEPANTAYLARQWNAFVDWFLGRSREVEGMIVWGGSDQDGDRLGDGAFFRVNDGVWLGIANDNNAGTAPAQRVDHTAIWTGETMAIWGGLLSSVDRFDDRGGEYDPSLRSWSRLPANGPRPRVGHTLTWTNEVAVVVGGIEADNTVQGDIWVLTPGELDPVVHPDATAGQLEQSLAGGSWQRLSLPADIVPRYRHTATWTGRYLVVFGGFDATGSPLADAYAIELGAPSPEWIDITANPAPTPRGCHQALWTGAEILMLGGTDQSQPAVTQSRAASACRTRALQGDADLGGDSSSVLVPEPLVDDPEARVLTLDEPVEEDDVLTPTWTLPAEPAPNYLGTDFRALWTANEATILQAVPQLESLGAVRYSPTEGTSSLPVPGKQIFGAVRGFTSIWINGGVIVWGGVEPVDSAIPGLDTVRFSNDGALLVLPDR